MDTRKCNVCGVEKGIDDFYVVGISKKTGRNWHYRRCKECTSTKGVSYRSRPDVQERRKKNRPSKEAQRLSMQEHRAKFPERHIFISRRANARCRGVDFTIEFEDIEFPRRCPVLGIDLFYGVGRGAGPRPDSPSIDRIDPSKGYVPGNVAVISHRANIIKQNATSDEVMKVALWMKSKGR